MNSGRHGCLSTTRNTVNSSATDVAMSYHRSAMTMTFPQQRAPYRFNRRKHSCCIGMENTFQIFPLLRFSWFSCPAQLTDVIELIHDKAQAVKIAKHLCMFETDWNHPLNTIAQILIIMTIVMLHVRQ